MTRPPRKPFWLLPNLLSLDAPLVAVLWLCLFARTWGLFYHPGHEYVVLGVAVWVIYVTDRLLDALFHENSPRCQARHHFHRRHWRKFATMAVVATLFCVGTVLTRSPMAIFSYLMVEMFLVLGFFAMALFALPEADEIPYAKNILAGAAFAYGTAMVAHVYRYDRGMTDLLLSPEFVCFAVLCILNISAIDLWEHADRNPDPGVKAADEMALTFPLVLLGGAAFYFAWKTREAQDHGAVPFFYAVLTGAALLYVLNRVRSRFSMEAMRVLADVVLAVPALVFMLFPDAGPGL